VSSAHWIGTFGDELRVVAIADRWPIAWVQLSVPISNSFVAFLVTHLPSGVQPSLKAVIEPDMQLVGG
jgi:hypothetical protein